MFVRGMEAGSTRMRWMVLLALFLAAGATLVARPAPASAHCDSISGPVVGAARTSLQTGDASHVLAYVQPDAEPELIAAFNRAREVRQIGGDAQQLADQYFFETAVRLHRAGEGAPYTGLKEITDFGPALEAAEGALATGSLDHVYGVLGQSLQAGVAEKYQAVVTARHEAAESGTVAAKREQAEAELLFEKYVLGLHQAATGVSVPAEGAEPTVAHAH